VEAAAVAPDTDRNLLFGVLALQAGLLDAREFAEACSAWAGRKDLPLAELLVGRGQLSPPQRALVEQLLEMSLQKHAGNAEASLVAVATERARHVLAAVADPAVRHSVLGAPGADATIVPGTVAYDPEGRGRYVLTQLHAQGGIGQVWLALDQDLGREVALKELRPERADNATALARFLEEAKITGQLEHPAIVPVHELVKHPEDGKPFYTMRFIKGRTLADAVQEYHRKREAGAAGPLDRRELLGSFVVVCNAVAYAHARGVLHRDLKPHNVVLGDFGEVMVLDWGLAKLTSREEADTSLLPTPVESGGSRDQTLQGQVLGTPAYMPPEQAEGRQDLMEPRSDVYALGAVLYELLTGQPPFPGGDTLQVLRQVASEPPLPPRKRVSSTPPALEAVCLKALSKKPADRYNSAKELAQEVQRWLADEPVTAYREPLADRLARWRRRHPTVTAVAALLLAALTAAALWGRQERDARALAVARQEAAVRADLLEAELHARQEQWAEARSAVARAEGRLAADASPELADRTRRARRDLDMVATLEDIRLQKAQVRGGAANFAGADPAYVAAFGSYDLPVLQLDPREAAARLTGSAIRPWLLVALYDWAELAEDPAQRDRLLPVAGAADADPWRGRLRDLLARPDRAALEGLARQPEALAQSPATLVLLARALRRSSAVEEAVALLGKAQDRYPTDFWLNHNLALYLYGTKPARPDEAVGYLRAALAVRPKSSLAHGNLGFALGQLGRYAEAEAEYRKVITLQPENALAHGNLGSTLLNQRRFAEAEAVLRRATVLGPDSLVAHVNLGEALQRQGRYAEALTCYRRAREIASRDPRWRGPSAEWVRDAERLVALANKLPAVLEGKAQPADVAERLALAEMCRDGPKPRYAASARLYAETFAAKAELGQDPAAGHLYNAACAAALAGCGQGEDTSRLGDGDRARLRNQARAWLRADLDAWSKRVAVGKAEDRAAARKRLQHWQEDGDLAGLRDGDALAKLAPAERAACQRFWADVGELLTQCAPR
jgi:serine/threonine-protein kinase